MQTEKTLDGFGLSIEMGNDAMQTFDDVASALRDIASQIEWSNAEGVIRDENGNTVGRWAFTQS